MKITVNQFDSALNRYIKDTLIPSFKNPLYIFAANAAVATNMVSIEPYLSKLSFTGIVNGDLIDLDKLDSFMRAGFSAVPTLDVLGIRFSISDYESFRRSI